jgi:hypothetical protein
VTNMRLGGDGFVVASHQPQHVQISFFNSARKCGSTSKILKTTVLRCSGLGLAYDKLQSFELLVVDDGTFHSALKLFGPDCGFSQESLEPVAHCVSPICRSASRKTSNNGLHPPARGLSYLCIPFISSLTCSISHT